MKDMTEVSGESAGASPRRRHGAGHAGIGEPQDPPSSRRDSGSLNGGSRVGSSRQPVFASNGSSGSGSVHCADWISLQDCHEHIDRHRPVAGTMEQRAIDRPPLKLKEIWAIRMRLQFSSRVRDLAMFNLAIDSKLRARDLTKLRVCDVCHKKHDLSSHEEPQGRPTVARSHETGKYGPVPWHQGR
jgi:hypothetical protein